MTRTARNRFVAWLGIAAMWLDIVAPVISQTLASHHAASDPQAVMCAAVMDGMQHAAPSHDMHAMHDDAAPAGHHDATGHFDACAYCGLLAYNLPIAQGVAPDVVIVGRVARLPALAAVRVDGIKSFNAAAPRAPPSLS